MAIALTIYAYKMHTHRVTLDHILDRYVAAEQTNWGVEVIVDSRTIESGLEYQVVWEPSCETYSDLETHIRMGHLPRKVIRFPKSQSGDEMQCLVTWTLTWEPAENLSLGCLEVLVEFYQCRPEKFEQDRMVFRTLDGLAPRIHGVQE
jgi:hypothetical protein